jgi:hypothetical protein
VTDEPEGERPPPLPENSDAEDVIHAVLRPTERVLWEGQPDRPAWRRAVVFGLGCLPLTVFLAALGVGTIFFGTLAVRTASAGKLDVMLALPASIGSLLLGIFLYPVLAAELMRRERRYVITSERALVVEPRRVEAAVELGCVRASAPHQGLFDDSPSGIELRVADGTAAIVFADMADPAAILRAVDAAIAAARAP